MYLATGGVKHYSKMDCEYLSVSLKISLKQQLLLDSSVTYDLSDNGDGCASNTRALRS